MTGKIKQDTRFHNKNGLGTMIPAPIYVRVMGNLFNGMIAGEPFYLDWNSIDFYEWSW